MANNPRTYRCRVRCGHCHFVADVYLEEGPRLPIGAIVYKDPNDQRVGRCVRCNRYQQQVLENAPSTAAEKPEGFWKVPGEDDC